MTIRTGNRQGMSTLKIVMASLTVLVLLPVLTGIFLGAREAKRAADRAATLSKIKFVATALDTYHHVHKSYPPDLDALLNPEDGPAYLSYQSMKVPGYRYDYRAAPEDFALRLSPSSGEGEHYYADKSGDVRISLNAPAGTDSPVWSESQ